MNRWIDALALDRLAPGAATTLKHDGKQLAVFRTEAGDVHAIDNRCPHEGYPLATGMLKDGILTCEWHNWKFRLCDGACVLGGEDVRSYPVRIEANRIWIDLEEPPAHDVVPGYYASLERAFDDLSWGHAARTVERLLAAGETPLEILGWACEWAAMREKYGFDHGLATAADLAAGLEDFRGGDEDLPLMLALSLLVEPIVRRPARELPAGEPPRGDVERELRRRIEAEDLAGAEALVRGAIEIGTPATDLFRWLAHAATDHFLDFGHGLIYVVKAEELLAHIGWHHAHPVLTSLVTNLVYGTREERLPYMKRYRALMTDYAPRLDGWAARAPANTNLAMAATGALAPALFLDVSLEDALAAVGRALDAHTDPTAIARGIALAASERLLRFDPAIDASDETSEGWLYPTHALTFADAVHETLRRRPSADTLRGLFQAARFVQHMAPLDLPPQRRSPLPPPAAGDIAAALDARDPGAAIAAVRAAGLDAGPLLRRAVVADRVAVPIFADHHVKVASAAARLAVACADDRPLVAAARFLAHPLRERRTLRNTRRARAFVRDGRMHDKLLGY